MSKKIIKAWIGHISWISSPCGVLFKTKEEAIEHGWDKPTRVLITVSRIKKGLR